MWRFHYLRVADRIDRAMAAKPMAGKHPIHIHPAPLFYRVAATGLSASMWFFVSPFENLIQPIADSPRS
jgi:hypothetical protein